MILEAVCLDPTCGETFNPTDENDLVHLARENGDECGGRGELRGEWMGPAEHARRTVVGEQATLSPRPPLPVAAPRSVVDLDALADVLAEHLGVPVHALNEGERDGESLSVGTVTFDAEVVERGMTSCTVRATVREASHGGPPILDVRRDVVEVVVRYPAG